MAHKKEYDITKNLVHKNIVQSIEMFDDEIKGEIHQIMGYIQGKEVLDHIAEQPNGKYTEEDAKHMFRQMMEGINYLHTNHVVHRDIKPQNLLVTKDNKVYILDFNVSSKKESSS